LIRKWKQPNLRKVSNIQNYLLTQGYEPIYGFIDLSTNKKTKHIDLVKKRFPNHEGLDIIYRPNYTWGMFQEPHLEIYYKILSDRYKEE